MRTLLATGLAALVAAVTGAPALAGTATAQMTVSVIVVDPPPARRADSGRTDGAESAPVSAATPIAVVEDRTTGTRMIVY